MKKPIGERVHLILKSAFFIKIIFPCCIQTELLNEIQIHRQNDSRVERHTADVNYYKSTKSKRFLKLFLAQKVFFISK